MNSLTVFTITLLLGSFIGIVITSIVSKNIALGEESELWEYRNTGLTPERIIEIDKLYLEKCEEVNRLRKEYSDLVNGIRVVGIMGDPQPLPSLPTSSVVINS